MAAEIKQEIALEIAHVLFIDIVAYSKMASDDQRAAIAKLNQIVQSTDEFRKAERQNQLLKIATGDGMALIFYHSPEDPVECALEISRAIKEQDSKLRLRMGVHSGPVSGVVDVNGRANVAGAGINIAQRVMDCGDAGHILLSKRVAEDLEQFKHWRPHLYHLGECEVKHGEKIDIVNLFTAELGNSERPQRITKSVEKTEVVPVSATRPASRKLVLVISACVAIATLAIATFFFWSRQKPKTSALGLDVPEKSIAVLPFENMSRDPDNAFFTDGVQDQILTALAKVADLKVISRTSVMQYRNAATRNLREIAQQLGVTHVLEGSVQRAGAKVRVNAQLINARTDAHEWAENYDRPIDDVFAIQSEISKAIADQLQAKLSPKEKAAIEQPPTADLAAFDLYTRAKTLRLSTFTFSALVKNNLFQAINLLDQAVARDPAFLLAWCELASNHDRAYFLGFDHTPTRLAAADRAVQTALRLRPDAGEAHLALAQHLYRGYLDYDRARAEVAVAQHTLPNDPSPFELLGFIDRRQGRWEESARNLERAIALDPRNFYTLQQISATYQSLHRYAEMAAVLDRALTIVPKDVDTTVARALVDLEWHADTRPLHRTIQEILAENPSVAPTLADTWLTLALCERDFQAAPRALAALDENSIGVDAVILRPAFARGLIARAQSDAAAAHAAFSEARTQQEKLVRAQPDYGPTLCVLGLIDAGLGRKEEAVREGRRAIELLPVAKESINGMHMIEFFAVICAWAGEKDLAFQNLTIATQLPSGINYGQLKLHPYWDPLRGDPRFEKIVNSLAPK
jgi:TolB-like protein/class 3 adenylate cyclase/Tfp pilus assembly protein PilF